MTFDRDDMSVFSYDTMADAVADGIEKYVERVKNEDEDSMTAADVMLSSSIVSASFGNDTGIASLYSVLRDMSDDVSAMRYASQVRQESASSSRAYASAARESADSNKRSKSDSVMEQTKGARDFFSDLGLGSLSKSIANWSSMFDTLGTQAGAATQLVSSVSDAMSNLSQYVPSALSTLLGKSDNLLTDAKADADASLLDRIKSSIARFSNSESETSNWFSGASAGERVEEIQNANRGIAPTSTSTVADPNSEPISDAVSDTRSLAGTTLSIIADSVNLYAGSMSDDQMSDFRSQLSEYIEDKNIESDSIEALHAATNIADSVMGNTMGPSNAAHPRSSLDTDVWPALGMSQEDGEENGLTDVVSMAADGLDIADALSGGKITSAIGGAASKVLGSGAGKAAGSIAGAAAGAAGSAGGGILSGILGAGSKFLGPIAMLGGLASWGMGQYREMNRLGNIQGDGAGTGFGYAMENLGQDALNFLGLTDVSGKDLNQYRQAASRAGFDLGTSEGNAAIDVQKYAKNEGIDPNVALELSRTVIEAGGSAEDVKDQFEELKKTSSELGVDFATLSQAAASTSTSLRQAGSEDEEAGTEAAEEMTELLKQSGIDNVEAGDIMSVAGSPLFRQAVTQMAYRNGDSEDIYAIQSDGSFALRYLTENGGKDAIEKAYSSTLGYINQMTQGMGSELSQDALMKQLAGQFAGVSADSGQTLFNSIRESSPTSININLTNTIGTGTQDQIQANAVRSNSYYGNGQSNIGVNNNGDR